MLLHVVQDAPAPSGSTDSAPRGFADRLTDALQDPAALELLLIVFGALILLAVFRRMGRVATHLAKRKELREYVRGLALLVDGHYRDAAKLLARVVERDPEHTDARIALGDAYYYLGDAAEAHRHHYHVERVFDCASPRVSFCLGRDLLAMGRCEEAVDHLRRAVRGDVEASAARALLAEALAALGREDEAIGYVEGPARETAARVGRLHAAAGLRALADGRDRDGTRHLTRAIEHNPGLLAPRMALVGRKWTDGDAPGAWREFHRQVAEVHRLAASGAVLETGAPAEIGPEAPTPRTGALDAPDDAVGMLGTGGTSAAVDVVRAAPPPDDALAVLEPTAESPDAPPDIAQIVDAVVAQRACYRCARCGTAAVHYAARCGACDAFDALEPLEDAVSPTLPDTQSVVDEIEENRHYVGRLVERLVDGDRDAGARLLALGPSAIPEIFQRMMEVADNRPLIALLVDMGAEHQPLMISAFQHMRTFGSRNILREGLGIFRSFDRVLAELFRAFGRVDVTTIEPAVDHDDPAVRDAALAAIVGLGRGDALERVATRVPPPLLIPHLNAADATALVAVMQYAHDGASPVVRTLADQRFARDEVVVEALDDPVAASTAADVIARRGHSAVVVRGLIARLEGPSAEVALRLLRGFGADAVDGVARALLERGAGTGRDALCDLLAPHGRHTVDAVIARLPLGDGVRRDAALAAVACVGDAALESLADAYRRAGSFSWLKTLGLARDTSLPIKRDLIACIAAIGSPAAADALTGLAHAETDGTLRVELERAAHALRRSGA